MVFALWLQVSAADLVRQLGDDDPHVRETADAQLAEFGERAEDELRRAAESDDLEVSARATLLLKRIGRRRSGFIVFARGSKFDGNTTIVRIRPDGSVPEVLADGVEELIRRSRDRERIEFEVVGAICEIDSAGRLLSKSDAITPNGWQFESPDGKKQVALVSVPQGRFDMRGVLHLQVVDGSGETRADVSPGGAVQRAIWSLDGRRVFFVLRTHDGQSVEVMNDDGTDWHTVVDMGSSVRIEAFHGFLDARRLLCTLAAGWPGEWTERLCALDVESGVLRPFAGPEGIGARHADVSPDGKHVAFVSETDVFVADIDGNQIERVATKATWHGPVVWVKRSK